MHNLLLQSASRSRRKIILPSQIFPLKSTRTKHQTFLLNRSRMNNLESVFFFISIHFHLTTFNLPLHLSSESILLTCLLNIENHPTFIIFGIVECMARFRLAMNPICGWSINKTTATVWGCSIIVENMKVGRRSTVDKRHEKLLWNFYSSVVRVELNLEDWIARVVGPRAKNVGNCWIVRFRFLTPNFLQHFIQVFICCRFEASANSWWTSEMSEYPLCSSRITQFKDNILSLKSARKVSWTVQSRYFSKSLNLKFQFLKCHYLEISATLLKIEEIFFLK